MKNCIAGGSAEAGRRGDYRWVVEAQLIIRVCCTSVEYALRTSVVYVHMGSK